MSTGAPAGWRDTSIANMIANIPGQRARDTLYELATERAQSGVFSMADMEREISEAVAAWWAVNDTPRPAQCWKCGGERFSIWQRADLVDGVQYVEDFIRCDHCGAADDESDLDA